ncbi:hypothetical protein HDU78_008268 [Chytriomyces hyalinus]|nr:hypothetical protein HDU78_008268 [Chytriomyces hyalinus]
MPPQQTNVPNRRGKPPAMLRCEKLIEITVADNPSAWTAAGFKVHQHPMPHRDPFVQVGQVTINLIGGHGGIVSWAFESSPAHNAEMGLFFNALDAKNKEYSLNPFTPPGFIVDGLATTLVSARDEERHDLMKPFLASIQSAPLNNPNGVTGLDHIVIGSKNASRTIGMLAMLGIHPRAPALERNGKRYWFFKSGDVVIELIEKTSSASASSSTTPTATVIPNPEGSQDGAKFWGLAFACADVDALAASSQLMRTKPRDAIQGKGRRICILDHEKAGISTNVAFITPPSATLPSKL